MYSEKSNGEFPPANSQKQTLNICLVTVFIAFTFTNDRCLVLKQSRVMAGGLHYSCRIHVCFLLGDLHIHAIELLVPCKYILPIRRLVIGQYEDISQWQIIKTKQVVFD